MTLTHYDTHSLRHSLTGQGPGGGVIQGSAGESAIVVMLAALKKKQRELGEENGARNRMVVYGSDQVRGRGVNSGHSKRGSGQ